jgi:CSLREA domain-containing protein
VAALIALAAPAAASAQTFPGVFTVDKTADEFDGECTADCTLREAVTLAAQTTGGGTPSISVPAGVYRLTRGALQLRTVLILGAGTVGGQGAGARTTIIDARGQSRVVEVLSESSAIIAGVTLRGGQATDGGGAHIAAGAILNLFNVHVEDNAAVTRGGGIHAVGTLGASNSTISGNRVTSGSGGGIAADSDGDIILLRSTVSGNTATANGGGITAAGSVSIIGSTIARNSATAGGGIFREGVASSFISMSGTIVAANPSGGACGSIGSATGQNFTGNLSDDATCGFTGSGGQQGVDPRLQPLRNNGGPTDTHALGAGSPAINAVDVSICGGNDQRGAAPVGACDIGAFEFGGQPPDPQLPPPVPGETVNVNRSQGIVRVKLPGSDEFFNLEDAQQVPVGTTFDTSKGRVNLVAAGQQKSWFYDGVFKFKQTRSARPLTTLTLTGALSCGKSANIAAKKKRRLWGNGKGKFRTKGKHSAATVVGTKWLVEDRCNGTLTKVAKGRVRVRAGRRTVVLTKGEQFFARAR